jgi:cysteine-rich repeat protein
MQAGEACDDGNSIEQDFCLSSCELASCGDGIVQYVLGEGCDDENLTNGDGCSDACVPESCGDGVEQPNEECDDGNANNADGCTSFCTLPQCGDGYVQPGEDCDDANSIAQDFCTNSCTTPDCGDGAVHVFLGEACDDGNQSNDDACLASCEPASCGDGFINAGAETCDASDGIDNDGCDADCVLSAAVQVVATREKTCALSRQGDVRCFGRGIRLGYGSSDIIGDDETPAAAYASLPENGDIDVGGKVVKLTAGGFHVCALLDTNGVRCWGANSNGQLGNGDVFEDIGDDEPPSAAGDVDFGAGTAIDVAAGESHTCVLMATGKVRCWGINYSVGYGTNTTIGDNETPAQAYANLPNGGDVDLGPGVVVTQIASKGYFTCALLSTGKVRCWGVGGSGAMGYPSPSLLFIGVDQTPAQAYAAMASGGDLDLGTGTVTKIATGHVHSCALLSTGAVRCWGYNGEYALGYPSLTNVGETQTPGTVYAGLPNGGDVDVGGAIVDIALGESHTCALLASGAVRCWGQSPFGQLGYGNTNPVASQLAPSAAGDVPIGESVTHIGTSAAHTCVVTAAGGLRCFGQNAYGNLGYGNLQHVGDNETPASVGDIDLF